jgi:hypothetical protein
MQVTARSILRACTRGNLKQQNRLEMGLQSWSSSSSSILRTSGRKSKSAARRQWLGRAACSVRRKLSAPVGMNAAGAASAAFEESQYQSLLK